MKTLYIAIVSACVFPCLLYPQVKFSAEAVKSDISHGSPAVVSLRLSVEPKWHIYGRKSELGSPTTFEFSMPKGLKLESLEWPAEKSFKFMGMEYRGYDGTLNVTAKISSEAPATTDSLKRVAVKAKWLACSDTCVPGEASAEITLNETPPPTVRTPTEGSAHLQKSPSGQKPGGESGYGFLAALFAAFAGGMILNLMPCVFPVIGLKILSFVEGARGSRRSAVSGAAFYALGIVASFEILAGALLVLRAAGENLGWGFQLQNPAFTAAMALLFFAMALSFAGAFEIGASLAGGSQQARGIKGKNGRLKSFMSGVVAVLVASPCTAPFMGGAVGAALSGGISAAESLAIFMALGLGMAAPYVVLSAIPGLSKYMPRPGMWMETLKQILSIPLFATAAWLAWLYIAQTGSAGRMLSAALVAAVGLRIYGIYSLPHFSKTARSLSISAAVASCAAALWICASECTHSGAQKSEVAPDSTWSAERLEALRAGGKTVYVDFTAAWCLTCQYNKRILQSKTVEKLFQKNGIVTLVGDWTNRNPEIAKELEKYGRAGVPLNLIFPPKGDPVILPAILTESAIVEAVDKIK